MKKRVLIVLIIFGIVISVGSYAIYKIIPRTNLQETVIKALEGSKGKYSIVIKNLKTNEEYSMDSHKENNTGSLYKLWIMATVFDQIQKGQLKKDDVLSQDVEILNKKFNIDPEYAELKDGVVTLTVDDALKQMITISHNYAALLLSEKIKISNVRLFLEKHNFKESKVGDDAPLSSSYDVALFLEKLYKGEFANEKYTKEMLDLLKMQKLNNKLTKNLPQGTVVAHKTGEMDFLSHDAGIIYTKKGDYIIVIFSESDFPPGANERIAQISKSVYDYLTK